MYILTSDFNLESSGLGFKVTLGGGGGGGGGGCHA